MINKFPNKIFGLHCLGPFDPFAMVSPTQSEVLNRIMFDEIDGKGALGGLGC